MIFYHFTALEHIDAIQRVGLMKGDVPLTETTGVNAVWLTTDPSPLGHGLTNGRLLNESERKELARRGSQVPDAARFLNKRAVRIRVKIPMADRRLRKWTPWARKRIAPGWLDSLIDAAGGPAKADTWYLCFGTIAPDEFEAVELLDADGKVLKKFSESAANFS